VSANNKEIEMNNLEGNRDKDSENKNMLFKILYMHRKLESLLRSIMDAKSQSRQSNLFKITIILITALNLRLQVILHMVLLHLLTNLV
jgi:hypothetical protein